MDIYLIKNKINKKVYIGKATRGFHKRYGFLWYKFIANKPIRDDLLMYGIKNFSAKVVAHATTDKDLCALEQHFIQKHNSIWPSGYNMQSGGKLGLKVHSDTKVKIAETMKSIPLHNRGIYVKSKIMNCETCGAGFRSYKARGAFQRFCSRKCAGALLTTRVAMLDRDLNLIKIYNSVKSTAEDGFTPKQVSNCLNNYSKSHKNFIWRKYDAAK